MRAWPLQASGFPRNVSRRRAWSRRMYLRLSCTVAEFSAWLLMRVWISSAPSSQRHVRGAASLSPGARLDTDIDPPIQLAQDSHQPIDREAIELDLTDSRKIRCGNAGLFLGCTDRQPLVVERLDYLCRQQSSELFGIRIWSAEVPKDIAATANDLQLVANGDPRFLQSQQPGTPTIQLSGAGAARASRRARPSVSRCRSSLPRGCSSARGRPAIGSIPAHRGACPGQELSGGCVRSNCRRSAATNSASLACSQTKPIVAALLRQLPPSRGVESTTANCASAAGTNSRSGHNSLNCRIRQC